MYSNTVSHSTASATTRLILRECHSITGFFFWSTWPTGPYWNLSIMNECLYLCRSLKQGHPWWLNLCFWKLAVGLEYSARLLNWTDLEWHFWQEKIWSVSIDFHNFLFFQVRYFFLRVQICQLTLLITGIHCSKDKIANILYGFQWAFQTMLLHTLLFFSSLLLKTCAHS